MKNVLNVYIPLNRPFLKNSVTLKSQSKYTDEDSQQLFCQAVLSVQIQCSPFYSQYEIYVHCFYQSNNIRLNVFLTECCYKPCNVQMLLNMTNVNKLYLIDCLIVHHQEKNAPCAFTVHEKSNHAKQGIKINFT